MDIFGEVWNNYLEQIEQSWNEKVTDEDIVLIAGDISWAMNLPDVAPDLEYLGKFKGKKVLLRGNHDYWWHSISAVRKLLPENIDYLSISGLRLEARQKLDKIRPKNLGQAGRISGVSPADIAVLMVYLTK